MSSRIRLGVLVGLAALAAPATGVVAGLVAAPGPSSGGAAGVAERVQAAAGQWAQRPCVPGWDTQTQVLVVCGWRGALPAGQGFVAVPFRDVGAP